MEIIDDDTPTGGYIVIHIPEEYNGAQSDVNSDLFIEDLAGNINKLSITLLNTACDLITNVCEGVTIDSDDETLADVRCEKNRPQNIQWS